jgi:hypothetical protein
MAQGDYLDMAIALAKSIKRTQSMVNSISIIVDCDVTTHSAVDHFIELPKDLSGNAEWKIHNRCQFYDLSPYDETVILDADMLFLSDVSHWWQHLSEHELLITNRVKTYRDTWVESSPYRQTFIDNQLPNVYSAFAYFRKCSLSKEFFELVSSIIVNWETWTKIYTPNTRQTWPSMDVAMALATKILDIESEVTTSRSYPTFTHMKSGCLGWKSYSEDWREHIGTYVSDSQLRLGNYPQSGILHYVVKDFINDEIKTLFK